MATPKPLMQDAKCVAGFTYSQIPTWQLKRIAKLMAPILVSIFNSSFKSRTVYQGLNLACVVPILKKPNLSNSFIAQFQMSLSYQKYWNDWFLVKTHNFFG